MMVSCVMCTYRRMQYVERAYSMFMAQDYQGHAELVIYNTDPQFPIRVENQPSNVKVINNGTDQVTGQDYTNVGAIRRDALRHASGDLHVTWDDDDVFLPWFLKQAVEGLQMTQGAAWKPVRSFFRDCCTVSLAQNTLEASVIVRMEEMSFGLETGSEGLSWYVRLRDEGKLNENQVDSIPAYAFDWSNVFKLESVHRQSGSINAPNNFQNHKKASRDQHIRPIGLVDLETHYRPFYDYFRAHPGEFNAEYLERYARPYIS